MNTIINHSLRKKLGFSVKEYAILDAFYYSSYFKGKKINAREIAEIFDFTKSSVEYSIKQLIKLGYLQKNRYNRNITVTELTKIAFLKN
jgi:DNA-binding MarR family transcriptional regulator